MYQSTYTYTSTNETVLISSYDIQKFNDPEIMSGELQKKNAGDRTVNVCCRSMQMRHEPSQRKIFGEHELIKDWVVFEQEALKDVYFVLGHGRTQLCLLTIAVLIMNARGDGTDTS